jgi:nucleotide-binding universal stress UspA family protein
MYQRILVAVDGSDTSNKALAAAIHLAKEMKGRVRLVHVSEEMAYLTGFGQYGGYSEELVKLLHDTAQEILEGGMAVARAAGVEADSMLYDRVDDRLADVVSEAAKGWNADLVVVGTHGRRGVGRLLLGSGAEQITRQCPVPVLVIRASEEGKHQVH